MCVALNANWPSVTGLYAWLGQAPCPTCAHMNSLIPRFQRRVLGLLAILNLATCISFAGDKINVLVWDEQQPVQKKLYPNFPGNYIANYLKNNSNLNVISANINQPEQGLSSKALKEADALADHWSPP